jgi:metal-responsive CopG/Arc/MetJ family transcriptional regulator
MLEVIELAIDKTKNTQILVTFPNDLIENIETYWHDNKLKNRNEAIRELVQIALKKADNKS